MSTSFLRPCLTSEFPEWKELVFICIFQDGVGVVFLTLECILPSNCMFNVLPGNRLHSLQRGALALGDFSLILILPVPSRATT